MAICAAPLLAQNWLTIGVKGGVPLTNAFADHTSTNQLAFPNPFGFGISVSELQTIHLYSGSREFVLGPMLEVQLPLGLAVEADALYRPINLKSQSKTFIAIQGQWFSTTNSFTDPVLSSSIDTWEFPVLAKYRLPVSIAKPYIEIGPSFRTVSKSLADKMSCTGLVAGIGVEMRVGFLHLAPEVRYTYWGSDGTYLSSYHAVSNQNQLELLAGLSVVNGNSGTRYQGSSRWTKYLSLGVRAGLPFSNTIKGGEFGRVTYPSLRCGDFSPTNCSSTGTLQMYTADRDYLVGPSVEIHLPRRLSVQADGLYGTVNTVVANGLGFAGFLLGEPNFANQEFHSWQFPVVLKYKLQAPLVAPYFDAGPTIRTIPSALNGYWSRIGLTTGLGVEVPAWKMRIAPEVRYVHWGNDLSQPPIFYASQRNQAQFLVGFTY